MPRSGPTLVHGRPRGARPINSVTSLRGKGKNTVGLRRDTAHFAQSRTNYSSTSADSRTFFDGALSPLLGSPSFRFPFPHSLFRTPRATRWGAALAESRFPTHYLHTLWKYAGGKRSVLRNAPYTSSWKAARG